MLLDPQSHFSNIKNCLKSNKVENKAPLGDQNKQTNLPFYSQSGPAQTVFLDPLSLTEKERKGKKLLTKMIK